jgi:hypothetical protein
MIAVAEPEDRTSGIKMEPDDRIVGQKWSQMIA